MGMMTTYSVVNKIDKTITYANQDLFWMESCYNSNNIIKHLKSKFKNKMYKLIIHNIKNMDYDEFIHFIENKKDIQYCY